MKRRRFLKAIVAVPAAPALFAQQPAAPSNPPSGAAAPASAAVPPPVAELPKLESTAAEAPADLLSRFLRAAKQDVRTATLNSRESSSSSASSGRRGGGAGQYWYPIE